MLRPEAGRILGLFFFGTAICYYFFEQRMRVTRLLSGKAAEVVSVCWVTTPKEATDRLASGIVSSKLAACVNVIPQVTSVYTWEGKVENSKEDLLMIKTRTELVDRLTAYVQAEHPYDTPEVISVKLDNGSPDYLNWVMETTEMPSA